MKVANNIDSPTDSPLVFQPLGRKNAYEEVSEEIRRMILAHKLPSAHRLPSERDLAEQFGVSRVVIREAIRSLERVGLLAVKKGPRGGIFVAQEYGRPIVDSIVNLLAGGNATLNHLFEVRLLIEPYAAGRAAELATPSELEALAVILRNGKKEADENLAQKRTHNQAFHRAILLMSHNPVMIVLGDAVFQTLSESIKGVVSEQVTPTALKMHTQIFEAIQNRQPAQAEAMMREDIGLTGHKLSKLAPDTLAQLASYSHQLD